MKIFIILLLLWLGLSGCATARLMNRVKLGMNQDQVVNVMGRYPVTTKANSDGTQILEYLLFNPYDGLYEQYWITLKQGKVVQFGRAGDFGSGRAVPY